MKKILILSSIILISFIPFKNTDNIINRKWLINDNNFKNTTCILFNVDSSYSILIFRNGIIKDTMYIGKWFINENKLYIKIKITDSTNFYGNVDLLKSDYIEKCDIIFLDSKKMILKNLNNNEIYKYTAYE